MCGVFLLMLQVSYSSPIVVILMRFCQHAQQTPYHMVVMRGRLSCSGAWLGGKLYQGGRKFIIRWA